MSTTNLAINKDRLWNSLMELGRIGEYKDESTGVMGVRRPALSERDAEGRALLTRWLEDAELTVQVDKIGNMFAVRSGTDNDLAPVIMGSHIDSVITGGRFDGPLGVLGALEVVRTLNENGIQTKRPIVVSNYTDEEGRWGILVGSGVAVGKIPLEEGLAAKDHDGIVLGNELKRNKLAGEREVGNWNPHAHLELHIEQGPILDVEGYDIGVVEGIPGYIAYSLTITSKGGHAGATPVEYRSDSVHDTQNWVPLCKSGMIFVPGKNDGISHNPMEYSTPEACENGTNVLLDAVVQLANEISSGSKL